MNFVSCPAQLRYYVLGLVTGKSGVMQDFPSLRVFPRGLSGGDVIILVSETALAAAFFHLVTCGCCMTYFLPKAHISRLD